jgi:7-cyano-7-deazaguanine synthase
MMKEAMNRESGKSAVVLVSGGMDSAVTLAIAREHGFAIHALSVAYGQRHGSELVRPALPRHSGAVHKTVSVDLRSIGARLTADTRCLSRGEGIPLTYVPARNTIMLSIARLGRSAWCQRHLRGVNAVDYLAIRLSPGVHRVVRAAGQPATRFEGAGIRVHAPLMNLSKADIAREGVRLGIDFSATVSCYSADAEGRACGHCDACRLRAEGFAAAGIPDPTRYR